MGKQPVCACLAHSTLALTNGSGGTASMPKIVTDVRMASAAVRAPNAEA